MNRLLQLIAADVGVDPDPVFEPSRAGDVRVTDSDTTLARDTFGYEPAIGIEEGLRRTVQAFRDEAGSG